jgi:uncharacterized phage protein gp47/JayE
MATFPTPAQIEAQYLQILKSIKPSININDPNSDFVIRGKALSGLVSGLYGDQSKVNNDTYISSMRPEALDLEGVDLGLTRQPATQAQSPQVRIPGTNGTAITAGALTLLYLPTNVIYTNTSGGTISGGYLDVSIQATVTGQIGNVQAPDSLKIVSPPSGVQNTATLVQSIADGSDQESNDSYRARLLSRKQNTPSGGNQTDYPNFAFAADASVRSALIRRFGRGLGTVDVYITTGTTDIDTAVTNGLSIIRIPSSLVLANVQAYYDAHVPLTDCPAVYAPTEVSVNATVHVELAAGLTLSSIPADPVYNPLGLTVLQLIQREVGRAMYKLPVGGRIIPSLGTGFVTAADIEAGLDTWLSAVKDPVSGLVLGKVPCLVDRQCLPLNGAQYDFPLSQNQLAKPGTVTVATGV